MQAKVASTLLSFSSYDDDTNGAPRRAVQAYAKLQGRHWMYYVPKLSVMLGRSPDADALTSAHADVYLGPSESISKKHIRIDYNASAKVWELFCFGKSGVNIDGAHYEPFCHPISLASKYTRFPCSS